MKPGVYRHYKGNLYHVIGIGRHTESLEEVVVYQSLSGDHGLWVRPKGMFLETVNYEGKEQPRFSFMKGLFEEAPEAR